VKISIRKVERVGMFLSIVGLILVFQPFTPTLFTYGYYLLALGAVIFTLSGYLPKRTEDGKTYMKDLVKWVAIIAFVILFVIGVSVMLTPYMVVR